MPLGRDKGPEVSKHRVPGRHWATAKTYVDSIYEGGTSHHLLNALAPQHHTCKMRATRDALSLAYANPGEEWEPMG